MKHTTSHNGRWILLLLAALGALMLFYGSAAVEGAAKGLALCGTTVIPSLFPFFVLSGTLIGMGAGESLARKLAKPLRRWFSIAPEGGMALVMGLLGGYPLGVRAAVNLYEEGRIRKQDAQRLLQICNNTGPSFFVGAVGLGLFGSVKIGLLLYAIHAVSALLVGTFCSSLHRQSYSPYTVQPVNDTPRQFSAVFSQSVLSACQSMLSISGFVVFFGALLSVSRQLLPLKGLAAAMVSGCLEMTSGVMALKGLDKAATFCLAQMIISWGGLCVHCQAMALLHGAGLQAPGYFPAKLLHGLVSGLISLPVAIALFGSDQIRENLRHVFWLIPGILVLFFLFFKKIAKKGGSISCQN